MSYSSCFCGAWEPPFLAILDGFLFIGDSSLKKVIAKRDDIAYSAIALSQKGKKFIMQMSSLLNLPKVCA
jgi:hypothetical protein